LAARKSKAKNTVARYLTMAQGRINDEI